MNVQPEVPAEDTFPGTGNGNHVDMTDFPNSNNSSVEVDSDNEDDPGHLLNVWLGELNILKKGLDHSEGRTTTTQSKPDPPCVKRRNQQRQQQQQQQQELDSNLKNQYRCSLINLEDTQDEELDAILGELSVLESQFESELAEVTEKQSKAPIEARKHKQTAPITKTTSNGTQNGTITSSRPRGNSNSPVSDDQNSSRGGSHSRSSSGSVEGHKSTNGQPPMRTTNGTRTESPDNDSAFCDNLSILSSCSASSSSRTDQSKSSGVSSSTSPTNQVEQDAKIKAEKIKLAIEKIKEASIKKLFVKVFTSNGSAKSILIDEKMTVGYVTRMLADKNHVKLDPKWTLVELVPDLYMERVYEDHENLVENCLMWKTGSKNTLWFIERPEKYDLFYRPELYLLGTSSSQKGDTMEDHSRQELLEEFFSSSGIGAPEVEGFIWLKAESKKSWKKFYFVLRSSGLYYAPKGKKTSKDLICLSTFDVNQVYYGAGWRKKYKSPSDFCFAIKHPQLQAKSPKYIRYLCVDTERELHQWVTGIRIAKNGKQVFENYQAIEEEITHADIDILTSKRLSVNSPNSLNLPSNGITVMRGGGTSSNGGSPARTPSSENKSMDSALSSGIASDLSQYSGIQSASSFTSGTSDSSETGSSQHTPVNTIERNGPDGLRRSASRSSKSSSSSGCMSDSRTSLPGVPEQGFESDFPAGGTIKKRPMVNPRIPLTTTTWGLVRDTDDDNNDGPNVRVGGGGTLLRSAMRQSKRKNSIEQQQQQLPATSLRRGSNGSLGSDNSSRPSEPVRVMAEVHNVQAQNNIDPMSADFESNLCQQNQENYPLPPPPRDESLDRLSTATDDLPPPPPELYEEETNHYHVSPIHNVQQRPVLSTTLSRGSPGPGGRPVPTPLPPSLKRNTPSPSHNVNGRPPMGRKISFDDNVQLIEESHKLPPPPPPIRRTPLPSPNKLYGQQCNSNAAPPKEFLNHLQKVMDKKWQIAEKCKEDQTATPHQVLGFRDEIQHLVGQGHSYSRNGSVGAWVLQSQQFNGHQQTDNKAIAEPLYAISRKQQAQFQQGSPQPSHYAPSHVKNQQLISNGRPVILREPTPEEDPYATLRETQQQQQQQHYIPNGLQSQDISNYSTLNFGPRASPTPSFGQDSNRSSFRGSPNGRKPPAPPPPRRNENTQLTTTY